MAAATRPLAPRGLRRALGRGEHFLRRSGGASGASRRLPAGSRRAQRRRRGGARQQPARADRARSRRAPARPRAGAARHAPDQRGARRADRAQPLPTPRLRECHRRDGGGAARADSAAGAVARRRRASRRPAAVRRRAAGAGRDAGDRSRRGALDRLHFRQQRPRQGSAADLGQSLLERGRFGLPSRPARRRLLVGLPADEPRRRTVDRAARRALRYAGRPAAALRPGARQPRRRTRRRDHRVGRRQHARAHARGTRLHAVPAVAALCAVGRRAGAARPARHAAATSACRCFPPTG